MPEYIDVEIKDIYTGEGVPKGGTTGQVLRKKSNADYDTEWADAGSGGGDVTGVKGEAETEYRHGNVNLSKENIGIEVMSNEDIDNLF